MKQFNRLFVRFIVRHLWQERLRSAATILGIALGIAVIIAIQLTNDSSVRGFAKALETMSGKTSLEITGAGLGFDELQLRALGWLRAYGQLSPMIEGDAEVKTGATSRESLRVLGVDILRDRSFRDYNLLEFSTKNRPPSRQEFLTLLIDPRAVILTEKFARRQGWQVGSVIELTCADQAENFVVRGLLQDEGAGRTLDGNFALMDIAAAQRAFQRLGRIDRLAVLLHESQAIEVAEAQIKQRLADSAALQGLQVQRPARRGRQVEKMLEAFHFNLTALSYIALLVGLFLIYNTVSISVITRRTEIGTLRALGTTRKQVLALFLAEAAVLAVIGCALGLAFGRWLSFGAVKLTATTVNALYIAAAAAPPPLGFKHFSLAFALGLPLALLAASVPALEAARVAPTTAMRGHDRLASRFRLRPAYWLAPVLLLGCAWWLAQQRAVAGLPVFGYVAALFIVFGAALSVPTVLFVVGRLGRRPLTAFFAIEGRLANANLAGAIPRLSISVAALAVSLSMMTAVAILIGSFRETVVYWVEQTLQADLYLRPATRHNVATDATFSNDAVALIAANPAIAAADPFRNFDVPYAGGLVTVGAGEFGIVLARGKLLFKDPANLEAGKAAMRGAIGRDAVVVSESFAIKYDKRVGDAISLPTPQGARTFQIVAVYYDYSSDRGIVVMHRDTLTKYWGEQLPTSLTVYLKEGAQAAAVKDELQQALGARYRVLIYTNAGLRQEVLRIFDSTFAITYALEAIAIFVAILGVASTLLTLILERKRDLALLRLIGADRRQVTKMVMIEAALLGGVSQGIGLVVGWLLSLVLIYVINVQSFGWTIQFHLPVLFLLQSSMLILVATTLSGLYPAKRAAEMHVAAEVKEE